MIKSLIIIFGLNLVCLINIFAQQNDTLILKSDTSRLKIPPIIFNKYQYINITNPDTITRNIFLWLPLKDIQNIFDYLPGYYLNYMDVGQINNLNYNQFDGTYTTVLRQGRPINDLIDGIPDFKLISINEISEIELTNGFSNTLYGYPNAVNIIERQFFRARPYTEIAFWQDRFENLYFDGNFHKNIFTGLNFNFGITKNSYDGKYTNSDFDKWQGRFNLNFIGSQKVNGFLNINYSHTQRGLNGGLNPSKVNVGSKDSLLDAAAVVRNSYAYERRTRFDIDAGLLFVYGRNRNSFTKLQLFTSNSLREYRDEENRTNPNGIFIKENTHWIDYGTKLIQNINVNPSKDLNINFKLESEYNKDLIDIPINPIKESNRIYGLGTLNINFNKINATGFVKGYRLDYFSKDFFSDFGLKPEVKMNLLKDFEVSVYASYSNCYKLPSYLDAFLSTNQYYNKIQSASLGAKINLGGNSMNINFYQNKNIYYSTMLGSVGSETSSGVSAILDLHIYHFNLNGKLELSKEGNPNGNAELFYRNFLFKNKLDLKVGFASKFWSDDNVRYYDGYYNSFNHTRYDSTASFTLQKIPANATLDFFLIGRIDKAIFGLTIENILNRAVYNTGLYPYQDRGGFLKTISRFNITWYFIN